MMDSRYIQRFIDISSLTDAHRVSSDIGWAIQKVFLIGTELIWKMTKFNAIFGLIIAISLIGSCAKTISPAQVACTMDAKVCPDGSTVGRVGPRCEFSPCPETGLPTYGKCDPSQKAADYCIEMFEPVCGNDGKEYPNSCFACKGGADTWILGSCKK